MMYFLAPVVTMLGRSSLRQVLRLRLLPSETTPTLHTTTAVASVIRHHRCIHTSGECECECGVVSVSVEW